MKNIVSKFALANPVAEPRPLKVGIINDSYILPSAIEGGESYFLQRINHHIFTNVDALQRNISIVTDHIREKLQKEGLADADNRVLRLVPTKKGQLYYKSRQGEYWRVYVLIKNGRSEERVTPQSAELAGEAFGRFQCQLADIPEGTLTESIPNFHNIEFRLQQLHQAVEADKVGRVAECKDILEQLLIREDAMCLAERLHRQGRLPKRINHCDTKVNNMMFDAEGKPLCIVDLDTVMPGYVLSDFGDFMRTAANTGLEDDTNLDNIHVNLDVFASYTRGYLREATFLTDIERSLLPFGCRLLSYMQAVRFFTDYLEGDQYYKIQYPEHNLVRTRAQLRLLEEQERCQDQMEAIVEALSNGRKVLVVNESAVVDVDQVNWPAEYPTAPKVQCEIRAEEMGLALRYAVVGPDLRATQRVDHGQVWTDSCCEFFCRIHRSRYYFNFEINCIGTMTASRRVSRDEEVRLFRKDDMKLIQRYAPLGRKPFPDKEGDYSWEVGMTIPFALLFGMTEQEWIMVGAPKPAILEANFYKCGDLTAHPHFLSWSPIHTPKPDFHRPEYFGVIIFQKF